MLKGKMEFRLGSEQRVCSPSASPVIREKSQFRVQDDSLSLSLRSRQTSLYLHFRALGRPFLWAAYFSPQLYHCGRGLVFDHVRKHY
jgi:hypothetical protein